MQLFAQFGRMHTAQHAHLTIFGSIFEEFVYRLTNMSLQMYTVSVLLSSGLYWKLMKPFEMSALYVLQASVAFIQSNRGNR